MPDSLDISLVIAANPTFPNKTSFKIQRGEENVGRCVGLVCTDRRRLDDWICEEKDIYKNPDVLCLQLPIAVLYEVLIYPRFRGMNFAIPATKAFLKWCEGEGCLHVLLNAVKQDDCMVDLVPLYEKSGFKVLCDSGRGKFMVCDL